MKLTQSNINELVGWVEVTKPNTNIRYSLFVIRYLFTDYWSLITGHCNGWRSRNPTPITIPFWKSQVTLKPPKPPKFGGLKKSRLGGMKCNPTPIIKNYLNLILPVIRKVGWVTLTQSNLSEALMLGYTSFHKGLQLGGSAIEPSAINGLILLKSCDFSFRCDRERIF